MTAARLAEQADRVAFGGFVAFGLLAPVSQGLQETTLGVLFGMERDALTAPASRRGA